MIDLTSESMVASGKSAEKLSLPSLQSKMKCDPEGYESELILLYRHFDSYLSTFELQSSFNTCYTGVNSDPSVAKELGDMAMFLAHVTPFYPKRLADFPQKLSKLLHSNASSLPASLRTHVTQALILLNNRKIVDIGENLALFMELQTLGDRTLRKLCFSHIVHSIRRMNQKHKNDARNRSLQNILFSMLQDEHELKAKRSLVILCDLHRRRVWFDERTANAICTACFHTSSRIMIATLSFLLGYERIEETNDSDDSNSDDEITQKSHITLSREEVYKAHHKGTTSSKKKKKAKLQRVMRSMKRQQKLSSEKNDPNSYSPLNHLKDAQGFVEKLFSRLQSCNERFEVKMMMLKVIARAIGLHRLILLNFYPFLQRYVQPHQRDVTNLLAAAVQACHDMVPPDAVEPLFKQVVNQFVHDRSRTEAIAVGLNVVREICLRIPLLMTEDLLQDLVLYKKSHEKAISTAARSLITLFRQICPSLLVKKDRGRPVDPKARPKAFGEVNVFVDVPGVDLLQYDNDDMESEVEGSDEDNEAVTNDEHNEDVAHFLDEVVNEESGNRSKEEDDDNDDSNDSLDIDTDDDASCADSGDDDNDGDYVSDDSYAISDSGCEENASEKDDSKEESKGRKRKRYDIIEQVNTSDTSLRTLKRLAGEICPGPTHDTSDGILSDKDFQRIRELKAKKEAKLALAHHGMLKNNTNGKVSAIKFPSSEQLYSKRVEPATLEINIRKKMSKEERLAMIRAGREDRGKYRAKAAVKQKKTGGLSNQQKEHKKVMPLAAKRAKVARSREGKRKKQRQIGKRFLGKKAWK